MKKPSLILSLFLLLLTIQCLGQDLRKAQAPTLAQSDADALSVPGASIKLVFADGEWSLPKTTLIEWVKSDARAVSTYYGRFPVPQLKLVLSPVAGDHIMQGVTFGENAPLIRVGVGQEADADVLAHDWILVHEMVHLAFPLMERRHHWIEEGIATYVEPIARAQAGQLSAEQVWGDMLRDMHQGLPASGDQGLDNTHTWGRTYWGGAMFCLLADVRLRELTNNRFGLQHALRAIDRKTGGITVERSIMQTLQIGDAATGMHVLADLYREMSNRPVKSDLDLLWKKLGVALIDDRVVFDDHAPLAKIRLSILAPLS
jgi:hypothetical protein